MLQGVSRFCKCAHETPQGVSLNPRLGKCVHETPQGVSGTQHTPEGVNLGSGCKTYAQTPGWYLQVIPPTIIPDLEPMPRPAFDDLDQPGHMVPISLSSPDRSPIASDTHDPQGAPGPVLPDRWTDQELWQLMTDEDLPSRTTPAVRPVSAPDPLDLPAPAMTSTTTTTGEVTPTSRRRPRSSKSN